MAECPRCGQDNPQRARFCMACGARLDAAAQARAVRKTVTAVCCGVPDADAIGASLDPESFDALVRHVHGWASSVLADHGASMAAAGPLMISAVFGIPASHDDDALRAVRAATELHGGLADLNADTQLRWGVSVALASAVVTAEVLAVEGDPAPPPGGAVAAARQLQRLAVPAEILLDSTTQQMVGPAVSVELLASPDPSGPRPVGEYWRLMALESDEVPRRYDVPLVDREAERELLRQRYTQTVTSRACNVVTVLGDGGVGKSRLVMDFAASVSSGSPGATLLRGRCRDTRHGLTYWPLVEMLKAVAGPGPEDASSISGRLARVLRGEPEARAAAGVLGALVAAAGAPAARENLGDAVCATFAALARERPLVVVVDDLQWASVPLLDLIRELAARLTTSPVLLCAVARPELLDTSPGWGGQPYASTIALAPLAQVEARQLVDHLLPGTGAETLRRRLVSVSGGNPLFIEELVRKLVDDGLLAYDGMRWVSAAEASAVPLPTSISALLTTRLDRLDDHERLILTRASLLGPSFDRESLAALLPAEYTHLDRQLAALVHRGHLDTETSSPGPMFRFRHQLLRDVAYRRLPLRQRAELHERFARWLQRTDAGAPDEIVGYHLERACRYRVQVGSLDATAVDLAGEAAVLLAAAGRRAFGRRDMAAAAELLGRAGGLFLGGSSQRAALLPDLAAALIETGHFDRAAEVLTEAISTAARLSDASALDRAQQVRAVLRRFTHPAETTPPLPAPSGTAAEMADWTLLHQVTVRPEDQGQGAAAGDAGLLFDATPVSEGVRRCMEALGRAADNATAQARSLAVLGGLAAMQGHAGQARDLVGSALSILHGLGLSARVADLGFIVGFVELLAREPARAADELRRSLAASERMGHEYAASRLRALLARAHHDQGDNAEAYRLAALSERTAASDDVTTLTLARTTRARAAAGLGALGEAAQLAREAVWTSEGREFANLHATALLDLGIVLRAAGRDAEAIEVVRQALDLYRAKGDRVGAAMALREVEPI